MHGTVRRFISLSYGQLRMPYLVGVGPRLPSAGERRRGERKERARLLHSLVGPPRPG